MTDQKRKELFPYFAYVYSVIKDPNKYGKTKFEDWYNQVSSDKSFLNEVSKVASDTSGKYDQIWAKAEEVAAGKISEDQDSADQQAAQAAQSDVQQAEKGAKLNNLKKLQAAKSKKCKCGCEMVSVKEIGGKMTSKCACGCSIPKKAKGGLINKYSVGNKINDAWTASQDSIHYNNFIGVPNSVTSSIKEMVPSGWNTGNEGASVIGHKPIVTSVIVPTSTSTPTSVQSTVSNVANITANKNPIKTITNGASNPNSIVDYLASKNQKFSFDDRKELAKKYLGNVNYTGTSTQNLALLEALKKEESNKQNISTAYKGDYSEDPDTYLKKGGVAKKKITDEEKKRIKMKEKGGILDKNELNTLNKYGVIDSSISNKWERKLNSHKLGKFKR